MASQITSLTVVYSTVYSDWDQRKDQSSTSLAFVWGIHRDRWIPRTKGQLRGKCCHLMTSSWFTRFAPCCVLLWFGTSILYPYSAGILHWHWLFGTTCIKLTSSLFMKISQHDRSSISPWTKSISNELDIIIHVTASQLSGHCDVNGRLWRHQQNENRARETRTQCIKIMIRCVV